MTGGALRVLAVGAHPDDVELGCGATLALHTSLGHEVSMLVLSAGEGAGDPVARRDEQQRAALLLGAGLFWGGFPDGRVPQGAETVGVVERVLRATGADVVYTHCPRDSHQDHRSAAEACLAAARRRTSVLLYESPTSRSFTPVMHVDVRATLQRKFDAVRAHVSQVLHNGLVDLDAVEAQARWRGFQGRVGYAEAFEVERFLWDMAPAAPSAPSAALATLAGVAAATV